MAPRSLRPSVLASTLALAFQACSTPAGSPSPEATTVNTPGTASIAELRAAHAQELARQHESWQRAPNVTLPLERLSTGHLVVPAEVGGRQVELILDSGASTSVLSIEGAVALGLDPNAGVEVAAAGAGGGAGTVRTAKLEGLEIGARAYEEVAVAIMDLAELFAKFDREVAGILGDNFLKRHDVEIDFPRGLVNLYGRGSTSQLAPDRVAGMSMTALDDFGPGIPKVYVSINGSAPIVAVFDLGAGTTVLNEHAAALLGFPPGSPERTAANDTLQGADTSQLSFDSVALASLTLADQQLTGGRVAVSNLPVFQTLQVDEQPALILGHDQLERARVLLDYDAGRLYVQAEGLEAPARTGT